MLTKYKTLWVAVVICSAIIGLQALAQKGPGQGPGPAEERPTNLKILPNDISHDNLIKIMRGFAKSLGVHCDKCHVVLPGGTPEHPKMDFALDTKPEKTTARNMMRMVSAINHKYIGKMGDGMFEQINCVTCHNGHIKPMVNVDSLPKMQMPMH